MHKMNALFRDAIQYAFLIPIISNSNAVVSANCSSHHISKLWGTVEGKSSIICTNRVFQLCSAGGSKAFRSPILTVVWIDSNFLSSATPAMASHENLYTVLEVSFAGQRPVIVAESGRVLHRGDDRAETLAPGAGRG